MDDEERQEGQGRVITDRTAELRELDLHLGLNIHEGAVVSAWGLVAIILIVISVVVVRRQAVPWEEVALVLVAFQVIAGYIVLLVVTEYTITDEFLAFTFSSVSTLFLLAALVSMTGLDEWIKKRF